MTGSLRLHTFRPAVCLTFAIISLLCLGACAVGPTNPAPQRYDLGPLSAASRTVSAAATKPALALDLQTGPGLDGTAMSFRLAYADERQLRQYRDARWAAPVAELLQQRMRAALAENFAMLPAGESAPRTLFVEVLEMAQSFDRPEHSVGVLRLRATLLKRGAAGVMVAAQRDGLWMAEAPRPDASGGARALQLAADAASTELSAWIYAQP